MADINLLQFVSDVACLLRDCEYEIIRAESYQEVVKRGAEMHAYIQTMDILGKALTDSQNRQDLDKLSTDWYHREIELMSEKREECCTKEKAPVDVGASARAKQITV